MAKKSKRDDIYNLKKLAEKMTYKNAGQKLQFMFNGVTLYANNSDIQQTIKILNQEHKATVDKLKEMKASLPVTAKQ